MVKSNDSDASLETIRAAASREQLNAVYVKTGTLMVKNNGQVKLAYRVSQVGGKSAPFRVNFAAAPGSKQAHDTIVDVADLVAATGCGTLDGVKHLLFGYKGGAFRGTDGKYLQVIDAVPAAAGVPAFSKMSVVQWEQGKRKPALSSATEMELSEFLNTFLGKSLDPVPSVALISMKEMPTVQSVLRASKLLRGLGDEAELSMLELFISAVFGAEVGSKAKVYSATAQLEGLLLGRTALRAGDAWRETCNMGVVSGLGAAQAGKHLRSIWFIELPKLSSSTTPPESKRPKVAEDASLAAFVPQCGTLSRLDTARIIFESKRVRKVAFCDAIPSDEEAAGSEHRFERRCSNALQELWRAIGKSMVPKKPPSNKRELEDMAESIYEAVSARLVRAEESPVRPSHLLAASADEDAVERKPDPPLEYAEAMRALSAGPAERLHASRARLEAAFGDPLEEPAIAMRAINDSALRDDLARAMSSNGKVYAPGEKSVGKRNQSPVLHAVRQRMTRRVAVSVRACAGTDTSCEMYMPEGASIPLAEAAMTGVFKWSTFSAASKAMRKSAAAEAGTVFEIAQTFELMETAWAAAMENIYGVSYDPGLQQLRQALGSTAQTQSAKLPAEQQAEHAKELLAWLERVTDHFEAATQAFRGGGTVRPDISASMAALSQLYSNLARMAAMAPMMAEWVPKQGTGSKRSRGGRRGNTQQARVARRASGDDSNDGSDRSSRAVSDGESVGSSDGSSECSSNEDEDASNDSELAAVGSSDGSSEGSSSEDEEPLGEEELADSDSKADSDVNCESSCDSDDGDD